MLLCGTPASSGAQQVHGEGRFFRYALRASLQKRPSCTALTVKEELCSTKQ